MLEQNVHYHRPLNESISHPQQLVPSHPPLSVKEFEDFVKAGLADRAERWDRPMNTPALMLELVGEVGEFFNLYKHAAMWRQESPENERLLKEEMGDILWYVVAVSLTLDYDISELLQMNMEKLRRRYGNFDNSGTI